MANVPIHSEEQRWKFSQLNLLKLLYYRVSVVFLMNIIEKLYTFLPTIWPHIWTLFDYISVVGSTESDEILLSETFLLFELLKRSEWACNYASIGFCIFFYIFIVSISIPIGADGNTSSRIFDSKFTSSSMKTKSKFKLKITFETFLLLNYGYSSAGHIMNTIITDVNVVAVVVLAVSRC